MSLIVNSLLDSSASTSLSSSFSTSLSPTPSSLFSTLTPGSLFENESLSEVDVADNSSASGYKPYSQRPETYLVPAVFMLIFITGIIGNCTLIYVLVKEKLLRSSSHLYILNLSLGDLIVIIGTVPFVGTIYTFESWPYGEVVCKFSEFIRDISIGVSVMTLSAMSIDRYRAAFATTMIRTTGRTGRGVGHYSILSSLKTQTGGVMLMIWLVAMALATPTAYFSFILIIPHPSNEPGRIIKICYPFPDELGPYYPKIVILAKCIVFYIIPLLIIGCCYVSIAVHLLSKSKTSSSTTAAAVASSSSSRAIATSASTYTSSGVLMTSRVRSSPIHPSPPPPSNSPSVQRLKANNSLHETHSQGSNIVLNHYVKMDVGGNDLMNSPVTSPVIDKNPIELLTTVTPATTPVLSSSPTLMPLNSQVATSSTGGFTVTGINSPSIVVLTPNSSRKKGSPVDDGDESHSRQVTVSIEKYSSPAAGFKRSQKKSQSRAKMILLLVIIFLVCFFPHHLFMMWFYYHPHSRDLYNDFWHVWRIVAFCLTFINSTLNPITLYLTSDQFKNLFNKYIWTACDSNNSPSGDSSSGGGSSDHHDHQQEQLGKKRFSSRGKGSKRSAVEQDFSKKHRSRNKSSSSRGKSRKSPPEAFSSSSAGNDNNSTDESQRQHREESDGRNARNEITFKKDCVGVSNNNSLQNHSGIDEEELEMLTQRMETESLEEKTSKLHEKARKTHQRKSTPRKSYFKHRNNNNNTKNIHNSINDIKKSEVKSRDENKETQSTRKIRSKIDQAFNLKAINCIADDSVKEVIFSHSPDTLDSILENMLLTTSEENDVINTSETENSLAEDLDSMMTSRRSIRLSMNSLEPITWSSLSNDPHVTTSTSPQPSSPSLLMEGIEKSQVSNFKPTNVQDRSQAAHQVYINGRFRRKSSPSKIISFSNNKGQSNTVSQSNGISSFSFSSSTENNDSFRGYSITCDSITTDDTSL